jgi:hypothetical protein
MRARHFEEETTALAREDYFPILFARRKKKVS